jgi:inosine/xanthosine triphosphatase
VRSIAVGSKNPVKIGAVREVIAQVWPDARIDGVDVPSGVRDQPIGDDETIRGALSRAKAARIALGTDLGVGIEGGIVEEADGSMRTCAWAAVVGDDNRHGIGGSLAMPLPLAVGEMIRGGLELGHAMDQLINEHNTKQSKGAVGILTAGLVDRQRAYEVLVAYALAPFLTPKLFEQQQKASVIRPQEFNDVPL